MDKELRLTLLDDDTDFDEIDQLYDECISYLKTINEIGKGEDSKLLIDHNGVDHYDEYSDDPGYETIEVKLETQKKTPEENNVHNTERDSSLQENNNIPEKKEKLHVRIMDQNENDTADDENKQVSSKTVHKIKNGDTIEDKNKHVPKTVHKAEKNSLTNKTIDAIIKEGLQIPLLVEARNEFVPLRAVFNQENEPLPNEKVSVENKDELVELKDLSKHKEVVAPSSEVADIIEPSVAFNVENELKSNESLNKLPTEKKMGRLRKLSMQLPKIMVSQSTPPIDLPKQENHLKLGQYRITKDPTKPKAAHLYNIARRPPPPRVKAGYGDFPKRLVTKSGLENVAMISNVPYEKIRLLNDTFHTLINLRWRWIVSGTIVVHFAIWLVFAVFWYITALAHYDFDPNPPKKSCITGGTDFVTIFLASVEAQTTIGFGDRAIDEECPESIFLLIMQLILGTGLSGVLTCVVYAKLTRPEKLSRDGVGFSKKAVISVRDGRLCLMMRAWDLNHDHIISTEFSAHFINTHRTKEGQLIHYYARSLLLQQRQFLLWPVTLVHVIDATSPLFQYTPDLVANNNYEITVSLKGASASMGTFTQSQTSYMPSEIMWGHRFPPVVKYDRKKQKYRIDHKKLDAVEPAETPLCSACDLYYRSTKDPEDPAPTPPPSSPSSFSERISSFILQRSSSFRNKDTKS